MFLPHHFFSIGSNPEQNREIVSEVISLAILRTPLKLIIKFPLSRKTRLFQADRLTNEWISIRFHKDPKGTVYLTKK